MKCHIAVFQCHYHVCNKSMFGHKDVRHSELSSVLPIAAYEHHGLQLVIYVIKVNQIRLNWLGNLC